jgi:hypothetical protein
MASYTPPTENLAIFDPRVFTNDITPITTGEGDKRYLRFPTAQGTENLSAINVGGVATFLDNTIFTDNWTLNDTQTVPTSTISATCLPATNPVLELKRNTGGAVFEETNITQNGVSYTTSTGTTTTATWAGIIAGGGGSNLQSVLNAGNSATGANAKIALTDSGIGGSANPQLLLENSNATVGNTNGVSTVEYYKSGRNVVANDIIASQRFNANNYLGAKTAFGRIDCVATSSSSGAGDDGALDFYSCVNGTSSLVFRMNGADNENNSFRPLDMTGNNIKSSSGNLTIETTASSGTGTINISAKTGAFININSGAKTDSSIQTLTGAGGSIIDFAGASPDERFDIAKDDIRLHWNNLTDQADISLENDYATSNSAISMFYQSPAGNIQTLLQNIPSFHTFKQVDGINARTSEIRPDKIQLTNSANGTTMTLDNNFATYENKLTLSGADDTTPVYTRAEIVNRTTNQLIQLTNNGSSSNAKTLTLINETGTGGALTYSNAIDTSPFTISSTEDLNVSSGNDIEISSANDIDILATGAGMGTRNVNITANGGVNLTTSSSLTMDINNDLIFTGASLQSASAGGNSGQHLVITLNGTQYKIKLENP